MVEIKDLKVYDLEECIIASDYRKTYRGFIFKRK